MGVYISGMEMPKKCQYCPISHWNTLDIITGCELVDRYVSKTDKDFWDNDRPSWCPLSEVPEPHGRLIDADALNYTMLYKENWMRGTGVEASAVWKKDIDAAKTIIPAEEGE